MDNKFYTFTQYIKNNKLTPAAEDYLEMIYRLSKDIGYTKVKDLALAINVKPPSVTKMLKKLNILNLVIYKKYDSIHLTEQGIQLGKLLYTRHNTISEFLKLLNINEDLLEQVEKIEHTINLDVLNGFNNLLDFFNSNPDIQEKLSQYLKRASSNI